MQHTTRLLFMAGSAREASFNKRPARLAHDVAEANGIAATWADIGDYPMPIYDGDLEARDGPPDNARKLKALFEVHDGIFLACPEYDASITPLLKNTIDWIGRVKEDNGGPSTVFKTRVFAIGSAPPRAPGGRRGLVAQRPPPRPDCRAPHARARPRRPGSARPDCRSTRRRRLRR